MCGICGFFNNKGPVDKAFFDTMVDSLSHRGPDDRGVFMHNNNAIGMRRLGIIDLEYGRQPMSNEDGTIWVVFNGEIYNYKELKSELLNYHHKFKTDHSDTEVLLHGYEQWGINGLLERLNGIFAFAIYDISKDALFLVRDKLGVKPLYYTHAESGFIFASEVKTLVLTGQIGTNLSKEALMFYLKYQFVPGEQTILQDVKKLMPGYVLKFQNSRIETWKYWDFPAPRIQKERSFAERAEELKSLLLNTVERQMMSDVPIGVFLSGGLDSSIIAYLMAQKTNLPIRSYSIVFPKDALHDESDFSNRVAKDISSQHRRIVFDEAMLLDIIDKVIISMDEPVADPAMIPTYFMSQEAGKEVKVILTGEGADEVLAGYPYYQQFVFRKNCFTSEYLPFLRILSHDKRKIVKNPIFLLKEFDRSRRSSKLYVSSKLSGFPYSLPEGYLSSLIKQEEFAAEIKKFINGYEEEVSSRMTGASALQRSLYIDTKLWLAEDLMMKLDKMTMAHSLEGRVPFLDHRIVEFAFNLPDKYKVGIPNGKLVLREAMKSILPQEILNREKHGFNVPLYSWFRDKLKDFVMDSLDRGKIDGIGLIRNEAVKGLIDLHMRQDINVARPLWILIVLCLWLRHIKNIPTLRSSRGG